MVAGGSLHIEVEEDSEEVVDGEVSEDGGFGGVQEINGVEDEEKSHHHDRKRVQRAFDCHFSQILLKSRSYLYQHFTAYSHFWKDLEKLLGDDPLQCPEWASVSLVMTLLSLLQ